jgi:hypothetical protein
LNPRDRLPYILVDVCERFDRERRRDPCRLLQLGAEAVVRDELQAAVRVVDQQHLLGPEPPLRERQRADHASAMTPPALPAPAPAHRRRHWPVQCW